MEKKLKGKKVAILVADGFEQVELTEPKKALEEAGAITEIVSPADNEVQGWNHDDKADSFPVDMPLSRARSDDYDALLLPGGVRNPDQLRTMVRAVEFIDGFFATGKPVIIEEMFPLHCSPEELGQFIERSKAQQLAAGWIGFYWGKTPDEYRRSGTIIDTITLSWLELFQQRRAAVLGR